MVSQVEFANCVKLHVKGLQYGSLPTWDLKEIAKVILRFQDNSETLFPEATKCSSYYYYSHAALGVGIHFFRGRGKKG